MNFQVFSAVISLSSASSALASEVQIPPQNPTHPIPDEQGLNQTPVSPNTAAVSSSKDLSLEQRVARLEGKVDRIKQFCLKLEGFMSKRLNNEQEIMNLSAKVSFLDQIVTSICLLFGVDPRQGAPLDFLNPNCLDSVSNVGDLSARMTLLEDLVAMNTGSTNSFGDIVNELKESQADILQQIETLNQQVWDLQRRPSPSSVESTKEPEVTP